MDDVGRPSFFELYAAERLTSALRPALKYVLEVLSVRSPSLMPLLTHSDDIFSSICVVLETFQLVSSSATLAESFYGLRRDKDFALTPGTRLHNRLSRSQIVLSVLFNVIIPHVKLRLDQTYTTMSGGTLASLMTPQVLQSLRGSSHRPAAVSNRFEILPSTIATFLVRAHLALSNLPCGELFLRWYPIASTLYDGVILIFNTLYLFGHTRYFSPFLALQGLVVRRLSVGELLYQDEHSQFEVSTSSFMRRDLLGIVAAILRRMIIYSKHAFITSIFIFRFLEHYFAADVRQTKKRFSKEANEQFRFLTFAM